MSPSPATSPAVGDAIEPFVVDVVDPGPMKTMAMLLRDPNPIHWDTDVTRELGLGDRPVNQGPINMSFAIEAAARAAGGYERIRNFKARFKDNVFGGERFECTGVYVAVDGDAGQGAEEGTRTATIELRATASGREVLEAEAVVVLAP